MRPSPWVRGSLNRRCSSSRRRIMTLPIQRSVSQATARNSSTNSTTRMSAEFTMVPRAWCPVAGDFRRSVAYLPSPSRLLEGTAAYASSPCFLGCGSKFHSERKAPSLKGLLVPAHWVVRLLQVFDDFANELPGFGNRIKTLGFQILDPVIGFGQCFVTVLPNHIFGSASNLRFIEWQYRNQKSPPKRYEYLNYYNRIDSDWKMFLVNIRG